MKRIVIPVVVGSSPIVHPNKFKAYSLFLQNSTLYMLGI